MKELAFLEGTRGRRPLPRLEKACLLILDAQRLFFDPSSPAFVEDCITCVPAIERLVAAFRSRGMPIIATRHAHPEGDNGGTMAMFWDRLQSPDDPLSQMAPMCCDLKIVNKNRLSAMNVRSVKREAKNAGTVVITGVQTHLCVLATTVHAASMDIRPVVVADACAARDKKLHLDALRIIASGHGYVVSSMELIEALTQ